MNPNQAISADETNVIELSESPGRRLRVQRQSRGLEIERVAAQLHLRPAIVDALEQDRYEDLPGAVFVAGYLRNYARLVGIDPTPLIAAYRLAHPTPQPSAPKVSAAMRREIGSGQIVMRLISLAVLVAALGMLALWWQGRADLLSDILPGNGPAALAPLPEESPGGADASPALALPAETPALGTPAPPAVAEPAAEVPLPLGAVLTPPPDEPLPTLPTRPESETATPPEPPQPAVAEAPAEREVALTFSGSCWIEVRDSAGQSVLSGEMQKGDRRVLEGQPPFSFVIGNASNASITVGGKPFDLRGVSRGNVARFKLDPEGAQ